MHEDFNPEEFANVPNFSHQASIIQAEMAFRILKIDEHPGIPGLTNLQTKAVKFLEEFLTTEL